MNLPILILSFSILIINTVKTGYKYLNLFNSNIHLQNQVCNGLVLSGGGSYGAYQNGILSNIIKSKPGIHWNVLSGVSSGSINTLYLSQFNSSHDLQNEIDDMKNLWYNLQTKDVYTNEYFFNKLSLYDNSNLENTLDKLFNNINIKNNVILSATSLASSSKVVWSNKDLENQRVTPFIMASTSLPILFPPYYFKDQYFFDGALSSNILLDETIQFCKEKYPYSKIHIDLILTDSYSFNKTDTQTKESISNIKDVIYSLINTITKISEYNELSDFENICNYEHIDITLYERNGDFDVDYTDFNQGKKLWNNGFLLHNTKILNICS